MGFKIIGVVGQIASGKGILVNYLTSHFNFISFSLSSIVHDELKKKGIKKFTRQTLQDVGDELRRGYGDEVLARRLDEAIKGQKKENIVIEGIRNPAEIEFLKKNQNFILIGVKANRELRFKRLLSRGKEWDPKTYEDFFKVDRRDIGVGQNKSGQQVGKCLAYCDYVVTNNKDLKDFQKKVERLVGKIEI
ncbi:MAG: AAA family ATPase [Patescibacteria group bacterium]